MEWDDDALDDESASPLLPPDDRLWRHPSEVAAPAPAGAMRGFVADGSSGGPRVVTVVALTTCVSVLLTIGVVALVRPFRDRAPAGANDVAPGSAVAALTAALRPAIAQVVGVGGAEGGGDEVGSGVLIREDGLLLTAEHLVAKASGVRVVLDDGRSMTARVVGMDRETDIAVLDLEGSAFPVAPLASADSSVAVGDDAIVIGSSGPKSPVVRVSMVSAVGQEAGVHGHKLVDVIRTDGEVAAGSSGGAVVDRTGKVIAIAAGGGSESGYATPISVAQGVASELLASGRVVRGWLGIEGESKAGAVVRRVKPGSPAEAAGLTAGDVIVAIDGAAVATMSALVARLRETDPGDSVSLVVRRSGESVTVTATLAEPSAS